MLVAIAGGALQGLELTYLAKKAGFETLLLDRRREAPATGICDHFVAADLTDRKALSRALGAADLVLPATENSQALQSLVEWCEGNRMHLAFDAAAYAISSSKTASQALFRKLGLPSPTQWPCCGFPVLAKPDGESGSRGVAVFPDLQALEARFDPVPPLGWVLQAYAPGPVVSVEVMGRPGDYTAIQTTSLEMDRDFDCKRVLAPSPLPALLSSQFEEMAVSVAEAIGLVGIMDLEAVVHEGQLKVLEIDARFPSQTPMAVYHSTGMNMVEGLVRIFCHHQADPTHPGPPGPVGGAILEHIRVSDGRLAVLGEHIMAEDGPLHLEGKFFGADEALTSYAPGKAAWVATLVVKGSDLEDARKRRDGVHQAIRDRLGLSSYRDESPENRLGPAP